MDNSIKETEQERTIQDLAMLVRRLVRLAKREIAPGKQGVLPQQALDYLQRTGLQGSILRNTD